MECQQITIINISLLLCRYNSVKMSKYNHRMFEIYDGLKTKTWITLPIKWPPSIVWARTMHCSWHCPFKCLQLQILWLRIFRPIVLKNPSSSVPNRFYAYIDGKWEPQPAKQALGERTSAVISLYVLKYTHF
jgi:hypothetical protein